MDRDTPGSSSTVRIAVRAAVSGAGVVMRAPGWSGLGRSQLHD
jgi:hypothetical protein